MNSIASYYFLNTNTTILLNWNAVLNIVIIGLLFLLMTYYTLPIVKQGRESKSYAKRWKKLRYNPDIFAALLHKSNKIQIPTDGLGIVVGNLDAKQEIIKVCNPYCGPCSKAHPELEHIIRSNKDVKLRVIFTASGEDEDIKTAPVAHLLAIQDTMGEEELLRALHEWYSVEDKDYENFAAKFPVNVDYKII